MIRIEATGNLTKDCEMATIGTRTVINFTIAENKRYKNRQGVQQDKVTYIECAYWRDADAEKTKVSEYLKKGTRVLVDGEPDVRVFTKQDGTTVGQLKINVNRIEIQSALGISPK
jgi:single-strand DNA-binding protein